jgi:hypothetical protein
VAVRERDTLIQRLEIPHGRFLRQIALSGAALRVADSSPSGRRRVAHGRKRKTRFAAED